MFCHMFSIALSISLRNDLTSLVSWANGLGLSLNINKGRNVSLYSTKSTISFPYRINNIFVQLASDSLVDLSFILKH